MSSAYFLRQGVHVCIKLYCSISKLLANGYALVWDNTQKLVKCRDQSKETSNKMLLWANAYAALNRVENRHGAFCKTLRASDLPLSTFLHDMADAEFLRERMERIVGRILVNHIPHFTEHYHNVVVWHIPHQHSQESARKSELVQSFNVNFLTNSLNNSCTLHDIYFLLLCRIIRIFFSGWTFLVIECLDVLITPITCPINMCLSEGVSKMSSHED